MDSGETSVPAGVALRRLDLGAERAAILVEAWDRRGHRGLAAASGNGQAVARLAPLAQVALRGSIRAHESRWRAYLDGGGWLDDPARWTAIGALETALADLAARALGIPLWRWLGGAARSAVHWADEAVPPSVTVLERPRPWVDLADQILARSFGLVRVEPLEWGGPGGVRRLDAIARSFQFELGLTEAVPLAPARALAIHVALAMPMAAWPVMRAGRLELAEAFVWDEPSMAEKGVASLPAASGLGITIVEERLAARTVDRVVVGTELATG